MVRITTLGSDEATGRRSALLLPGVNYTAQAPLLYWSTAVLLSAGWHIRIADWEEGDRAHATPQDLIEHVFELNAAEGAGTLDLVVAKSLGTLALPRCIDENIAGVWLTPLLNRSEVAAALLTADRRHLAVGGTNDRHWIPEAVQGTAAELVSVEGADHALLHDDWRESMRTSNDIAERIAAHLASL
ncbi:hypothetical protein [Microbacterium sp. KRD172]|uniref:hypothetical protein n=1 Tax=unclassified Microbacterium TaxID=2609290 RepID=UPI0019D2CE11|nr:hypothetical protein [Microbacterium sp. KRD172]